MSTGGGEEAPRAALAAPCSGLRTTELLTARLLRIRESETLGSLGRDVADAWRAGREVESAAKSAKREIRETRNPWLTAGYGARANWPTC